MAYDKVYRSAEPVGEPLLGTQNVAVSVLKFADGTSKSTERLVPVECPIAFEYNGIGYAVMMGTPNDLEDFVLGFTVSEGLAAARDVSEPTIFEADGGYVVRCNLPPASMPRIMVRARTRVSESGCGICGIDSIAAALAPLAKVGCPPQVTSDAVHRAIEALYDQQSMARATGASHAAAWCSADGAILCVREDVGRHNALDKLIGAISRAGMDLSAGFALLSARCSQELVEKTARAGMTMLVTISAPSSLAIQRAKEADLTLIALARSDTALVVCDPYKLFGAR